MNGPEFTDEEFDRIERLVDQGRLTYSKAKEQVAAERPAIPLGKVAARVAAEPSSVPQNDPDVSPTWNVNHTGLDQEQQAINKDGISLVRAMGELVNSEEYRALSPEGRQAMRDTLIARHNAKKQD